MKVYIVRDKYSGDILEVCKTQDAADKVIEDFPNTSLGKIHRRQGSYQYLRVDEFDVIAQERISR